MKFQHALLVLSWLTASPLFAQGDNIFSRKAFSKEISFVQTDTAHGSHTTVIEYPQFLAVIELPMIDEGGGRSTNLVQDIPKAEKFLKYLLKEYNNKPVKYVFSTHWHLHSLSGITPFFSQGAKLVTTKSNWIYSVQHGLFGSADTKSLEKQVLQVTNDTTLLRDTGFPIQVLFLNETYTNKPTKDYLFFYFEKIKSLHASCMCAMSEIDFNQRPDFVYSDRVTDLDKAISSRKLEVNNLFKLTASFDPERKTYKMPVFSNGYFNEFKKRGKPMATIVSEFAKYPVTDLTNHKDSILHLLVFKKVSAQIVNATVYQCINQKEYTKAVEWARILNLYHFGDADYIDTLGEAYYYAGDIALARQISEQLASREPARLPNQLKVWEQNKANSAGH